MILNDKERAPDDRPSIGIILCAEKDNLDVEPERCGWERGARASRLPARSRRHPAAGSGVDFVGTVRFVARRCRGHGRMPLPTGWKPALPKANPIGVAEYQLQPKLPAELKGKLPTAKQLADAMKGEMGRMKDELQRS